MHPTDYVTKTEFHSFVKDVDLKFDEFRQLIIDMTNMIMQKIDEQSSRIDRLISQNALEHHSFDVRLAKLESKLP